VLADKESWSTKAQGSLGWRIHVSGKLSCVVWVDKKPVLLLSTHAKPVSSDPLNPETVPRTIKGRKQNIPTSPVHKEYTTWMRGVDVSDQLRGEYSCQVRSHKWWHRLLFFMIDTCRVNAWIVHKSFSKAAGKRSLEHIDFTMKLAEALMANWGKRRGVTSVYNRRPCVHSLVKTTKRRVCRHCHSSTLTNLSCPQCGDVFFHLGTCFFKAHFPLRRYESSMPSSLLFFPSQGIF
jgi:hypothetical protein